MENINCLENFIKKGGENRAREGRDPKGRDQGSEG
jgi:hypothetical protein